MATPEERKQWISKTKAAFEFMERHLDDYVDSPQRYKVLNDYLEAHGLPMTADNLDKALAFAVANGVDMATQVTVTQKKVEQGKIDAVKALPLIPGYMPQIKNRADLRAVDGNQFKELRTGKHGKQWMARVSAVLALPEEN